MERTGETEGFYVIYVAGVADKYYHRTNIIVLSPSKVR
jgi:hypothetical protein